MNFNNRLSSTLANNIKLDSNVEHEAEKIAGGNIIWLVNRPAGVKIYVNSTPDRTGALVLNEANRGYKWEELGEYGSLKLYDNFYIWTEGTNLNNEKIELQISPNADIITPILGNTADKINSVSSVGSIGNIANIDKIKQLEQISDNVIYALYESQKNLIDTSRIKFLKYVNGTFSKYVNSKSFLYTILADFAEVNFIDTDFYKITISGICALGDLGIIDDSSQSTNMKYRSKQSLHIDLIDLTNITTSFTEESVDTSKIENAYSKINATGYEIETKDNHFTFLAFYYRERLEQWDDRRGIADSTINPSANNFKVEFSGFGSLFKNMRSLILSLKVLISNGQSNGINAGYHFSLKIQIDKMGMLPNSKIITSNPYINNDI